MAVLFFWGEMEYGLRLRSVAAGVSFEDLSGFLLMPSFPVNFRWIQSFAL